jgi:catechol 2,3-dioxygenase-like lactoylglutathione lyase family enzyme
MSKVSYQRVSPLASTGRVDMKLEVVVIPVSDVDRAKGFYGSLGWRLDADFVTGDDFRVVQFTPPGSGSSIIFGKNVTSAEPGSAQGLHLIVPDIGAARDELVGRGVEVSEVFHDIGGVFHHAGVDGRVSGPDPDRRSYGSFASFSDPDGNGWLFQEVTTRLPGRPDRPRGDHLCLRERSGECASPCCRRARAARGADGRGRSELARLVRRVHGAGAGRGGAAVLSGHYDTRLFAYFFSTTLMSSGPLTLISGRSR